MTSLKKHIVFVCSRLDLPGGTERAIVNLANLFVGKEHKVTILILDETAVSFYPLNSRIQIVQSNLNFGITKEGTMLSRKINLFRHIRKLKVLLKQTGGDIIIGTEYYLSIVSWMAAHNSGWKIISWEHHHIHWLKKNKFWTLLFKKMYPKFDLVVCQNSTEKKLFEAIGARSTVIPYSLPGVQEQTASLDKKKILTIGWLINRKGIDLIPTIAQKAFEIHKDWHWKIIGKGEEYDWLQKEIQIKNLSSQLVIQSPQSQDLSEEYRNTSIYVMTSRFECLPMVLLEASSFGIPLIAFDCPTGPADIIQHDKNGLLIKLEDVDAMADAIIDLMEDEWKRKVMGEQAYESSKRYSAERVYGLWEDVLS